MKVLLLSVLGVLVFSSAGNAQYVSCLKFESDIAVQNEFRERFGLDNLSLSTTCSSGSNLEIESVDVYTGEIKRLQVKSSSDYECMLSERSVNEILAEPLKAPKIHAVCGAGTLVKILLNRQGVSEISRAQMSSPYSCQLEARRLNSKK